MATSQKTNRFGLIGFPLSHTFSPSYFSEKFRQLGRSDAEYLAYELEQIEDLAPLLKSGLKGLNVTIPYKEKVFPFLDHVEKEALAIGAVNTIKITSDEVIGYNTDVYGFRSSLMDLIGNTPVHNALILGSGGAAKAVKYALAKMKISHSTVSRKKEYLNYGDLDRTIMESHTLIINTTPLGMSPNINSCPDIPYHLISDKHFLYDLVYNPEKTLFLKQGSDRGAKIKNGYDMLVLQAEKSWEIWNQ